MGESIPTYYYLNRKLWKILEIISSGFGFLQIKLQWSTPRFLTCETQAGPDMYKTFFCRPEFAFQSKEILEIKN